MSRCTLGQILPKGSVPVVELTFYDVDGVLADPDAITLNILPPGSSTPVIYETPSSQITQVSPGVWRFAFPDPLDTVGTWWVRVVATGTDVGAAQEYHFAIGGTRVPTS